MKLTNYSLTLISIISTFFLLPLTSSQSCHTACGKLQVKYPFGSGSGCGDPRFQSHVACDDINQQLIFTTHTGSYPVTDIDYVNQIIYISDATMSTCWCKQPSKGFGLDWDAPFSFHDDTVFTLIDCQTGFDTGNQTGHCDRTGAPLCSYLYSNCKAISLSELPISTCCVYTPVDLGPSFEMNLDKLQCSSYSGLYGFTGQQSDPANWKYGIAIKYKFNVYNEYPKACGACEKSNGACAYNVGSGYNPFLCSCPGGFNTTSDCYFLSGYNHGFGLATWHKGIWLIWSLAWMVVWLLV